ncbi:MAG TPA: AAA family ATPase [Anaerolineae bacterium]|nr:AAA family ATPase [Anaerolineae bacterium]
MKALYITSVQRFSGKTAFCLALGQRLQKAGYKVGYFKPVSTYPWEPLPGRAYDEDATFIRRILNLEDPLAAMVGVVLAPSMVQELRCGCIDRDLMPQIEAAYRRIMVGKDIMLVEGGASLREGLSLEVDPVAVANRLDLPVLAMLRYRNPVSMGDACVDAYRQLGKRLIGLAINAVPEADCRACKSASRVWKGAVSRQWGCCRCASSCKPSVWGRSPKCSKPNSWPAPTKKTC